MLDLVISSIHDWEYTIVQHQRQVSPHFTSHLSLLLLPHTLSLYLSNSFIIWHIPFSYFLYTLHSPFCFQLLLLTLNYSYPGFFTLFHFFYHTHFFTTYILIHQTDNIIFFIIIIILFFFVLGYEHHLKWHFQISKKSYLTTILHPIIIILIITVQV